MITTDRISKLARYDLARDTRKALTEALELAVQHDASESTIASLACLLVQRGCEHIEGDGTLTSLCDVVMFG